MPSRNTNMLEPDKKPQLARLGRCRTLVLLLVLATTTGGCSDQATPSSAPSSAPAEVLSFPRIVRRPSPFVERVDKLTELPHYDRNRRDAKTLDLYYKDLSTLDLKDRLGDLRYAGFTLATRWPPPDRLPADFDLKRIVEFGKNPGLGIRALHKVGITGAGVGIAIIDEPLLVDHVEYKERLRLYEEIPAIIEGKAHPGWVEGIDANMHGSAVASIAVGKEVGVAPQADLYFIATCPVGFVAQRDFTTTARAIDRILEINQMLTCDRRIRVISMSIGWDFLSGGVDAVRRSARRAREAGLLVISSSVDETHGFTFNGLGRDPLADPDKVESYCPGLWWGSCVRFPAVFKNRRDRLMGRLMVPMDSRMRASPRGPAAYAFDREGGWSWSIPWIAGLYALAVQVRPDLTPDEFWKQAMDTGTPFNVQVGPETECLGRIVNPAAMIVRLREKSTSTVAP